MPSDGQQRIAPRDVRRFLGRLYRFFCNEFLRIALRTGTVEYRLCLSCPRCPSREDLGTTTIIPHYPAKLASALGLPVHLYVVRVYPDQIAQEAFRSKPFGSGSRPTLDEERDFINGLVQVDFHERLHLFLDEEGPHRSRSDEGAIESLESRLATFLFPEYGIAEPRPWHTFWCLECRGQRGEVGNGDAPNRPLTRRPLNKPLEVT